MKSLLLVVTAMAALAMVLSPNLYAITDEELDELKQCEADGYDDGQNSDFDHGRDKECLHLNEDVEEGPGSVSLSTYYHNWIRGCMDAGNTREICETFTDA